jgi:hypothetical protein
LNQNGQQRRVDKLLGCPSSDQPSLKDADLLKIKRQKCDWIARETCLVSKVQLEAGKSSLRV